VETIPQKQGVFLPSFPYNKKEGTLSVQKRGIAT